MTESRPCGDTHALLFPDRLMSRWRLRPPHRYLWHGTKHHLVKTIEVNGFDERVCALDGLYGAGVYFAEKCSKSDQYATPAKKGGRYPLLPSRVMLGSPHRTTKTMRNTRRPPGMRAQRSRPHDSIVAAVPKNYREFIVYAKTQAYPEFLIEYIRE